MTARRSASPPRRAVGGAALVEFALIAVAFFAALFGVIEMGRLLWTWNAAIEATRYGARLAVVCPVSAGNAVKARVSQRLPGLTPGQVRVEYLDASGAVSGTCTSDTCAAARVSLSGYAYPAIVGLIPVPASLPAFSTTLRREYMEPGNPDCT